MKMSDPKRFRMFIAIFCQGVWGEGERGVRLTGGNYMMTLYVITLNNAGDVHKNIIIKLFYFNAPFGLLAVG
jgi:hypothetical protein